MLKLDIRSFSFFLSEKIRKQFSPLQMDVQNKIRRNTGAHAASVLLLLLLPFTLLASCQFSPDVTLDRADRRFASFYSDYLIGSGVTSRNEDVMLAPPSGDELRKMLDRHDLTPGEFRKRIRLYREQPERWKKVLALVRTEVQRKRP